MAGLSSPLIDGKDVGQEPDVVPAQGKVAFKASVGYIPVPVATGGPVTVMKGPIMGVLDDEGYLCTPHPTSGEPMYRGVRLIATDDPDMAVTDWTWSADYRLEAVNGNSMQIPAHSFALPSDAELDLTTLVKVPSSPGYGLPQAESAVNETITGATVVGDDLVMTRRNGGVFTAGNVRGATGAPGPKGDPGPSGVSNTDQFYQVSQAAGRTVSVWDYLNSRYQLVYGDTGRRNITALFDGTAPNATVGISGGSVYLTRVGRMVELNMENVTLPPGQTASVVDLGDIIPAGFLPPTVRDYPLGARLSTESTSGGGIRVNRGTGRMYIYLHVDGETIRVTATWLTEDPWPAVLPGIAVGSIPSQ